MAFDVKLQTINETAQLTLSGDLDASSAAIFKESVELAVRSLPRRLVLRMDGLRYMASAGLRALVFAKQKMGAAEVVMVGAQEGVLQTVMLTGLHRSVTLVDALPEGDMPSS